MADAITPSNKNPSPGQALPVLEPHVKVETSGSVPEFQNALTQEALTPNVLATLGNNLADSAATQIAQQAGIQAGKAPTGNALPPITKADEIYVNSYYAQSKATLANRAQQLLNSSSEQLDKAYVLNPDLVQSYNENLAKGMQDIVSQAPDAVKQDLYNSVSQQIINASHQANVKMINQQKERNDSQSSVYVSQLLDQTNNAGIGGNAEAAKKLYDTTLSTIDQNVKSGIWTPIQGETSRKKALINYYASTEINKLMAARAQGKEAEFVANTIENKPKELSWADWKSVRDEVVGYLGEVETLDNRNQSLLLAQAKNDLVTGKFGPERAAYYESQLNPTNYLNLMTHVAIANKSNSAEGTVIAKIVNDPGNAESYVGSTPKVINAAYDQYVQGFQQQASNQGVPISEEEAQFQAANVMAAPVPKFIDMINRDLTSANPAQIAKGLELYERLHESNGLKTIGVKPESLAVGNLFRGLVADHPEDPAAAARKAQEIVFNKTPDKINLNQLKIDEYFKSHANNSSHLQSWAIKISGLPTGFPIENSPAFASDMHDQFSAYMQMTDGNTTASENMLKSFAAKTYGITRINGEPTLAYLPVEKAINIPDGATGLIQLDIMRQLEPQFAAQKKSFDQGSFNWYWRVKDGQPTYEQYSEKKSQINSKPKSFSDFKNSLEQIGELKQYMNGHPMLVEKVVKNVHTGEESVEEFQVKITTAPYAQVSPIDGYVKGGYVIQVQDKNNVRSYPDGYFGKLRFSPDYRPDRSWIQDKYLSVNGLTPTSSDEFLQQYQVKKQQEMSRRQQFSAEKERFKKSVRGNLQGE